MAERRSAWSRARELGERTPAVRNRYVDFLRAASIVVVVVGHWLVAAAYREEGALHLGSMLQVAPWSQWLTWPFQVMPVFFAVGGYANAASWESARRSGRGYAAWAATRLTRLVGPVVPLLLVWSALAVAARRLDVPPEMVRAGSRAALVPVWFLAVYVMTVVAVPVTHRLWRRYGMASFGALAIGAAAVDALGLGAGFPLLRWANYGFVWLAVHQLGYAWRANRLAAPRRTLSLALLGLMLLIGLVGVAGYPVSMISVPGEAVSNSRPPTLALLALGAMQVGLLLSAEAPMRRWLAGARPWTATVFVNGAIMTLFLWHLTAMVLVIGLANWLGGLGLGLAPDSAAWWLSRPLWITILTAALLPWVVVFGRFEWHARERRAAVPPAWQLVVGAALVCAALGTLARGGIGRDDVLGLRLEVVLLAFVGWRLVLGRTAAGPRRGAT
ncbi:MAG: acyltransferase [Myxococcota bacterium]|nr:acyltransferase [Myxococcota bacterium]